MLPLMVIQVDEFHRHTDGFEHGIAQGFGFADHGHHQAVVVFIVAVIQQFHTLAGTERCHNFVYLLQVASFAEVGDAFHNSVHNGNVLMC